MRILGFGGCRINNSISWAEQEDPRVDKSLHPVIPRTFSIAEVNQALDVWEGRVEPDTELSNALCLSPKNLVKREGFLDSFDVIVLETSAQTEIFIDGFTVNRNALSTNVLQPIRAQGKEASQALSRWFNLGITGHDDDLRTKYADKLLAQISNDLPNAELLRRIVKNMTSRKCDPLVQLKALVSRVNVPIAYLTHTWQFMADGRQLRIPEGFYEEALAAAEALNLAIYQPEADIIAFGVDKALRQDFRHYSDEFIPHIGKKTVDFAATLL